MDNIPLTGVISLFLADIETDDFEVIEPVYDDDTGELVSGGSTYVYEQDFGGVTYRVTAINPVISGEMVTFTLRDAEQIS